jgi:hypothetical protein
MSDMFALLSNVTMPTAATTHDDDVDDHEWMLQMADDVKKWWFVLIIVFGIPGNTMSLLITLKKDNRRISTCIYMASLALVDSGVIVNAGFHYWLAKDLNTNKSFLR